MFQQKAHIAWNQAVAPAIFKIGLTCRHGFARTKPGQFVMLRISEGLEPLLRRPFSVHKLIRKDNRVEGIEVLYKTVGKGTGLLAARKPGETLDVLGPLGSSFVLPPSARKVFIVAGGIGVAPMVFLAQHLVASGLSPSTARCFSVDEPAMTCCARMNSPHWICRFTPRPTMAVPEINAW